VPTIHAQPASSFGCGGDIITTTPPGQHAKPPAGWGSKGARRPSRRNRRDPCSLAARTAHRGRPGPPRNDDQDRRAGEPTRAGQQPGPAGTARPRVRGANPTISPTRLARDRSRPVSRQQDARPTGRATIPAAVRSSLMLTRLAGDRTIELLTLQNMAMHAGDVGRPLESLNIARNVLESARLTPRIEALFLVREARALAQMSREAEARHSLGKGMALFSDGIRSSDPAWTWWLDERQLLWQKAAMEGDLGNWSRSIDDFTEASHLTSRDRYRSRYMVLSRLLAAQSRAAAWADAEETANQLVEYSGVIESGRVTGILRRALVATKRNPHGSNVVAALRDGLGVSV
jgi:hypothetical protein